MLAGAEPHVVPAPRRGGVPARTRPGADVESCDRTRLVFANYPNNPTAAVASREYLERLVATCRRHEILLAYDNAYCDLTFDGYVAPSIFEIAGAREVAIEFHSLSKSFSMTGWRIGFAAGNPRLIGGSDPRQDLHRHGSVPGHPAGGGGGARPCRGAGGAGAQRARRAGGRPEWRRCARRDLRSRRRWLRCTSGSGLPAGVRLGAVRDAGPRERRRGGPPRAAHSARPARGTSALR